MDKINMKEEYEIYDRMMPVQTDRINGGEFSYRFYKNPNSDKDITLVFLAGGSGLADGMCMFCNAFKDNYNLLTFYYPVDFKTNRQLADALAELLGKLDTYKVYLFGQSYGGIFAQVMAKYHPECVRGLILSSTCSMYNDINYEGITNIMKLVNPRKLKWTLRMDKVIPSRVFVFIMKLMFKKLAADKQTGRELSSLIDCFKDSITREYWYHMDSLLGDLMSEYGTHKPEDFAYLENRVLLISSKDDEYFNSELNNALIRLMPCPTVIDEMDGGHLALILNFKEYVGSFEQFIDDVER